jgi:2-haloacid dehalogenase
MHIIFDLGKVLIDWDPRYLYSKVFDDEAKMEWFLSDVCHPAWNLEQDRGRSFHDGVIEATMRHPDHAAEIAMYRDRWMEMVPGAVEGSVAILEELHIRGVPLYAITNWNGDSFRATRGRFGFLSLFKDVIVSGDEKLLKPDPAIYELLTKRHALKPKDCLFIDDSMKNVLGAIALGWQGHHFTSAANLRKYLVDRGLL